MQERQPGSQRKSSTAATAPATPIRAADQTKKSFGSESKLPALGSGSPSHSYPLVAQPAVHVQVDEFGTYWRFGHPLIILP
jgi:hypothetical protein